MSKDGVAMRTRDSQVTWAATVRYKGQQPVLGEMKNIEVGQKKMDRTFDETNPDSQKPRTQ